MSWGYSNTNGPTKWVDQFPIAAGKRQSPIDIRSKETQFDRDLEGSSPMSICYCSESQMELTNTGHSVMASVKQRSELKGGPLKETYRLEQFHLHWGATDSRGSEHTIDGEQYAAELHLVHWNTKYSSFAEAANKSDGLAVIGVMIKPAYEHPGFQQVSEVLDKISKKGSKYALSDSFSPSGLLPANRGQYWTYEGSLTTPPLYESVLWIVMKQPVGYSTEQLSALRSLCAETSHIQDNFRPPCPLHGRVVRASFP